MKIALMCRSVLLQKALKNFLKEYITSFERSDFVICDRDIDIEKPVFLVGGNDEANLKVPFSKESLIEKLKEFYKREIKKIPKTKEELELEKIVEELNKKHKEKLSKIVKEYYEK
jgi:competence CoiA-like predicted nuclease